jgi:hypothetical protein
MSQGASLHIGLNSVSPAHYDGWDGKLNACEADANDMDVIAQSQHFKTKKLLTKAATRNAVRTELKNAAGSLKRGDIFFLSYSGHGGQLPDKNNDESDFQDETWCLYDGELVDDELYAELGRFEEGVRIIVLSDSCHSGTVVKMAFYFGATQRPNPAAPPEETYRFMPDEIAMRTYRKNKQFYDEILTDPALKTSKDTVKASVILISGCQDNQLSLDGTFNGLFTANLLRAWGDGAFAGSYRKFHRSIKSNMPPTQTPNFFLVGKRDISFERQRPFQITTTAVSAGG